MGLYRFVGLLGGYFVRLTFFRAPLPIIAGD